jgi:hypothetical protein
MPRLRRWLRCKLLESARKAKRPMTGAQVSLIRGHISKFLRKFRAFAVMGKNLVPEHRRSDQERAGYAQERSRSTPER